MSRHYVREVELQRALRRHEPESPAAPVKAARRRKLNLLIVFRRHGGRPA